MDGGVDTDDVGASGLQKRVERVAQRVFRGGLILRLAFGRAAFEGREGSLAAREGIGVGVGYVEVGHGALLEYALEMPRERTVARRVLYSRRFATDGGVSWRRQRRKRAAIIR